MHYTQSDLLAYAPEFGPSFRLSWTTVPHSTCRGDRPAWWATARDPEMLRIVLMSATVKRRYDPGKHRILRFVTGQSC